MFQLSNKQFPFDVTNDMPTQVRGTWLSRDGIHNLPPVLPPPYDNEYEKLRIQWEIFKLEHPVPREKDAIGKARVYLFHHF